MRTLSAAIRSLRRRAPGKQLLTPALTVVAAVSLGLVLYIASTSIPYLATSPTTDPIFGSHNQCLLDALPDERLGFAVSSSGHSVAGFNATDLVLCTGQPLTARRFKLSGVQSAAFDFANTLWIAVASGDGAHRELLLLGPKAESPVKAGDFSPIAVVGHGHGAAAVDASGRIISVAPDGAVRAAAALPKAPTAGVQLTVDAKGELLAVVTGTGFFVYRTSDLTSVAAESPCDVEFFWWRTEPGNALVSCAPEGSWALELSFVSGQKEAAAAKARERSSLVPLLKRYVQACDHLPCSAPEP